jgi:hypothetical protein
MHGIPKILQTRADFDAALSLARSGDASPAQVAIHFEGLIESAYKYAFDKVLADGDAPDGDKPEYIVVEPSEKRPTRRQLKRVIDGDARIYQLGYNVAEVETIINELGVM